MPKLTRNKGTTTQPVISRPNGRNRTPTLIIGIDPGVSGGLCCISPDGIDVTKMPTTDKDLFQWLNWYAERHDTFACIERIDPRPTAIFDHVTKRWTKSILKSTCIIYGNYVRLRMALTSCMIPFEDVDSKLWQKTFGMKKKKGEKSTSWKNRLKAKAQELFPNTPVTLYTADALLIAEHYRRKLGAIQ